MTNTNSNFNAAVGAEALLSNTDGDSNTAVGFQALMSNTIGGGNAAVGAASFVSGHWREQHGFGRFCRHQRHHSFWRDLYRHFLVRM